MLPSDKNFKGKFKDMDFYSFNFSNKLNSIFRKVNTSRSHEICIQWNPREVNTLEVNSRLKSTPHGGPDFFLLCLSNFISLKVNLPGPILG